VNLESDGWGTARNDDQATFEQIKIPSDGAQKLHHEPSRFDHWCRSVAYKEAVSNGANPDIYDLLGIGY
jgi:hypothetical protein